MAKRIDQQASSILLIAALLLLASSAIAFAGSDSPFIVVHKKASITKLREGSERVAVSIDIYNRGSVTAFDVSMVDEGWLPHMFHVVSGNTSMTWEKLEGGSSVSHRFELEPKVKGPYQGTPALVTFRVPTKSGMQVAYSTPILPLNILEETAPDNKLELAKRLLAQVGPPLSAISFVVLIGYIVATPSKSTAAARANKKRR